VEQWNSVGAGRTGWSRKKWLAQEELVGAGRTGWSRKKWVAQAFRPAFISTAIGGL